LDTAIDPNAAIPTTTTPRAPMVPVPITNDPYSQIACQVKFYPTPFSAPCKSKKPPRAGRYKH